MKKTGIGKKRKKGKRDKRNKKEGSTEGCREGKKKE